MKKLLLCCLLSGFALGGIPLELIKNVKDSVVLVGGKLPGRACTGFFVEKGYIITAAHCIPPGVQYPAVRFKGKTYPAEIVKISHYLDIAAIKLVRGRPVHKTLKIGTYYRVGQDVWIMGHPKGENYSVAKGIISKIYPKVCARNMAGGCFLTDCAVNHGNSGGPALNMKGEAIGVVSWKMQGGSIDNMGYAVSLPVLHKFVKALP